MQILRENQYTIKWMKFHFHTFEIICPLLNIFFRRITHHANVPERRCQCFRTLSNFIAFTVGAYRSENVSI